MTTTYTWQQISDRTGYSDDDLQALTAEWIGEPGYLDGEDQPTQATLDLLLAQRSSEKPSYSINRDGLAPLALPLDLETSLRDVLDEDTVGSTYVADLIEAEVSDRLAAHGVSSSGEWLGDWSAADIVRRALQAVDDIEELGSQREQARRQAEEWTALLSEAVERAMSAPGANESAISRRARVDRMTARKWAGKG